MYKRQVCYITFKFSCNNGAETKERFRANQNTNESRRIQNSPTSKIIFLFTETPCMDLRAGPTRKVIRRTCQVCNPQSTHAPPRRDRQGENTRLCITHTYVYWSPLSLDQWRLTLSKLEKNLLRLHSWGQRSDWLLGWAVSYCTDQLLTPYVSGASTLCLLYTSDAADE